MWRIVWDKIVDIFGDRIVYMLVGIVACAYGIYHINQYFMTRASFATEKDTIVDKIEDTKAESNESDLLLEYKVLEMEDNSVRQQLWALQDRIEKEAESEWGKTPTISQQSRLYQMEKRIDEIRQRKMEIQKELNK